MNSLKIWRLRMLTSDQIATLLWQKLKDLAANQTIPIAGSVWNGHRRSVGEDIVIPLPVTHGFGNRQQADVNINVFADDLPKSGNVSEANEGRLATLSQALSESFISTFDETFPIFGIENVTQTKLSEPSANQHYINFLLHIDIYDYE